MRRSIFADKRAKRSRQKSNVAQARAPQRLVLQTEERSV